MKRGTVRDIFFFSLSLPLSLSLLELIIYLFDDVDKKELNMYPKEIRKILAYLCMQYVCMYFPAISTQLKE